jgi:predicted acylesterase/phospholipase RssA
MPSQKKEKTALVLAGGGMTGAAYEIGALTALNRLFLPGFSTSDFDVYVGTSAGAIIATLMASCVQPVDIFQAIVKNQSSVLNWRREDIYRLDKRELWSNLGKIFQNALQIFRRYRLKQWDLSLREIIQIVQEQMPAGLYSLEPMQSYFCSEFRKAGIKDDFGRLDASLCIIAYDLDTMERVIFGSTDYDHMHICSAIAASCAYPLFFRPFQLENRYYVDGSVGRVDHIDVAIDRGAGLIIVVNPRVPIDNETEDTCLPSLSLNQCSSISDLGATFAWEQAQRIENREKMSMALELIRLKHPDTDIIVFEPGKKEALHFFQGPMSHHAKTYIMMSAYHQTLVQILSHFEEYRHVFSRHDIDISKLNLKTDLIGGVDMI